MKTSLWVVSAFCLGIASSSFAGLTETECRDIKLDGWYVMHKVDTNPIVRTGTEAILKVVTTAGVTTIKELKNATGISVNGGWERVKVGDEIKVCTKSDPICRKWLRYPKLTCGLYIQDSTGTGVAGVTVTGIVKDADHLYLGGDFEEEPYHELEPLK